VSISPDHPRVSDEPDPSAVTSDGDAAPGLDRVRAVIEGAARPPAAVAVLGLRLLDVEEGRVTGHYDPRADHTDSGATIDDGVMGAIAHALGSLAILSELPGGVRAPTLEMKVNHVRPVRGTDAPLRAEGRVISRGRTTALAEARVHDAGDRLVAFATVTCSLVAATT